MILRPARPRQQLLPWAAAVLALLCWLAIRPPEALAHAAPARSDPAAGAALATPPTRVDIWFDERVTPGVSSIQVFDQDRRRVDAGGGALDGPEGDHLSVDLERLGAGVYTVVWANVAADDGHPNRGGFSFRVLTPGAADQRASAAAVVDAASTSAGSAPSPELLAPPLDHAAAVVDLLSAWLTFGALVLAGGGALFALRCLQPAFAALGPGGAAGTARLQRRFFRLVVVSASAGALAGGLSLLAKAEIATALPPRQLLAADVLGPLLQAWSGTAWLWREAIFGALAVAGAVGGMRRARTVGDDGLPATMTQAAPERPWRRNHAAPVASGDCPPTTEDGLPSRRQRLALWAIALLGAAGLLLLALDSHLAMGHVARPGPFGAVALSLHLMAAGAWVGGLGYAALVLRPSWRVLSPEARMAIVTVAVARFSPLALASVVVLTVTGAYAALLLLPTPADLLTSAYGQALDAKAALLLVLILFGAANRRTLARAFGVLDPARAGRGLLRAMRLEWLAAATALLAAATLLEVGPPGAALPAAAAQLRAVAPLTGSVSASVAARTAAATSHAAPSTRAASAAHKGALTLHADLAFSAPEPAVGATEATLRLVDDAGRPVDGAQVQALWLMPEHLHLTQTTFAPGGAPGVYVSRFAFGMAGAWHGNLSVTLPDRQPAQLQFRFNVRDRGLFGV